MSCPKSQCWYDGFDHFVASVNLDQRDLVAMFTLYCDDSGTHAQSDVAVAACYVSTVEQWTQFKRNWDEANKRENFGVFHMADFVGRQQQFSSVEWSSRIKRDRTLGALINIIRTRARIGFATAVVKSAYDDVIVNGGLKERFGENHYAFAVRMCTAMVDRWRRNTATKSQSNTFLIA